MLEHSVCSARHKSSVGPRYLSPQASQDEVSKFIVHKLRGHHYTVYDVVLQRALSSTLLPCAVPAAYASCLLHDATRRSSDDAVRHKTRSDEVQTESMSLFVWCLLLLKDHILRLVKFMIWVDSTRPLTVSMTLSILCLVCDLGFHTCFTICALSEGKYAMRRLEQGGRTLKWSHRTIYYQIYTRNKLIIAFIAYCFDISAHSRKVRQPKLRILISLF